MLLARALRRKGDLDGARKVAADLMLAEPRAAAVHQEMAIIDAESGRVAAAVAAMERAFALTPRLINAWRALGDAFARGGEMEAADAAYARHIRADAKDPSLLTAAAALAANNLGQAERALKDYLKAHPTDVAAMRMLAEAAVRLGRLEDAGKLLDRCLQLAPSFDAARANYAALLSRQNRAAEALAQIDRLLAADPHNRGFLSMRAAALVRLGDYEQAIAIYEALLGRLQGQAKIRMSYGHALKTVGRTTEAVAAYQAAIAEQPQLGEAWWSLANLKTHRFSPADIGSMRDGLRGEIGSEDRYHLHFALGKALEDSGAFTDSFAHYAEGARLRRRELTYDAAENRVAVRRAKSLYTTEFFAERAGAGDPRPDPIFIVGLPRAGSTLIEQILASHSAVEGTMELPDIIAIARELGHKKGKGPDAPYPQSVAALPREKLAALGADYLARTRPQRKTARPFFIDKMPNNFVHVGLILAMLPNAKIIDARRHPLACCFSAFKQHFARGQSFSYDLAELGAYFRDYVELMAHFDAIAPGRIHRVFYERMVGDFEGETRRLLDYCKLPFEPSCLKFHENERPVRTASSEQVRLPIFTEGLDQWRNYDAWLGPLKAALGDALDKYPEIPAF